jgi:hypothetical protein
MTATKVAVVGALLLVVLLLAPTTAAAEPTPNPNPGGDVTNDTVTVHITVSTAGGDVTLSDAVASSAPLLTWKVVSDNNPNPGDLSGWCRVNDDPSHPQYGWQYRIIGTDTNGATVVDKLECVPFADGNDTKPAPPPLPQLPTLGEAWASARLPAADTRLDPPRRGVTGLDTRIVTTGTNAVTISATVRGYTITGTATAIEHVIDVDGTPVTTGTRAHLTFSTKGIHIIEVTTRWHAVATLTGPDLIKPVSIDLGTATVTVQRKYPVIEIRSVLQP